MSKKEPNTWIKPILKENGTLELHFVGDIIFDSMEDMDLLRHELNDRNLDFIAYSSEKFKYYKPEETDESQGKKKA